MPDPSILGFGGTNSGANVTTTTVDIAARAGTPRIGDIVLIAIVKDGTGAFTWPSGWTSLTGLPVTFAATNNQGVFDVRYRKVLDGDSTTVAITHASEGTAHQVYRIDGTGPLEGLPEGASPTTGDSTNPDPPNLAPSWGARTNTLWLAFACNDGNTAITAGPASYTNFQNDRWANTNGVGIATGRRTTNGSSENPGTFTMATEQWAAVTIGFNPGIALDFTTDKSSGVSIEVPSPRLAYREPLTIAENLLQSTLAPIQDNPFVPIEFRNPDIKPGLMVGISSRLSDDSNIATIPPIFDNPQISKSLRLTWINNNLEDNLAPSPNPNNQFDWPNPVLAKKTALTHVFYPQLEEIPQPPFLPIDYPNPLLGGRNKVGIEVSRPQYYQDIQPFAQYDWNIPAPKLLKSHTWINNLLESTLAPPVVVSPFHVPDFVLPNKKGGLIVNISSTIVPTPPEQPPFVNEVFVRHLRKSETRQYWTFDRPFYYQDTKPFKQDDYPNPALRKPAPNTWISYFKPPEPIIFNPFIPVDYPNPRAKSNPTQDWIFLAPFQQIFTQPVGSAVYDNPLTIKKINPSWDQSRPSYYTEPTNIPAFGVLTFVPDKKKLLTETIINRFTLTSVTGDPTKQTEWPNPLLKKPYREGYEFVYIIDDNLPRATSLFDNPQRSVARSPYTWLYSSQISEANPIKTYDYPNPILVKRIAHTLINNLLPQLNPAPTPAPFYQTDYPNPLIGNRNFHQGIQDTKKFYFVEPSIQIGQFDWPVFRAVNRNQVGSIQFIIPPEINKLISVTENPVLKKRIALTWLYNSITSTPVIVKPFNQNEWVVVRPRRYPNLGININYGYILPNIIGRSICLASNVTEFDLESNDEIFDLDSRYDEFNIEAGGTECE